MRTIEQLVDIPAAGFPRWSPDGARLAYLFDRPGVGWQLWRHDPASGDQRLLSDRPVRPARPAWSPDGTSIAIVCGNSGGGSDIWLVPVHGDDGERRLTGGGWECRSPSFSPDGASVAFISGEAGTLDIWIVPAAG